MIYLSPCSIVQIQWRTIWDFIKRSFLVLPLMLSQRGPNQVLIYPIFHYGQLVMTDSFWPWGMADTESSPQILHLADVMKHDHVTCWMIECHAVAKSFFFFLPTISQELMKVLTLDAYGKFLIYLFQLYFYQTHNFTKSRNFSLCTQYLRAFGLRTYWTMDL